MDLSGPSIDVKLKEKEKKEKDTPSDITKEMYTVLPWQFPH
jgi:hypothetical protein